MTTTHPEKLTNWQDSVAELGREYDELIAKVKAYALTASKL